MLRMRVPRRALLTSVAATGIALHDRRDKPSIYPSPEPDILLLDTPSDLEKHIGTARRYVTDVYTDAHAQVQGVVSKWIGVEHAVESRVKSIIAPEEPLTPGILYVGVAALTGSILTRNRLLPTRIFVPPIFLLVTLNHFLPKTSHNIATYFSELEQRYTPGLREKHLTAKAHSQMTWERAKEATKGGREGLGKGVEGLVGRVQETTGLKLRETLGWGEQVLEKAEAKAVEAIHTAEAKAGELRADLDNKVGQTQDEAEKKAEEVKRLV